MYLVNMMGSQSVGCHFLAVQVGDCFVVMLRLMGLPFLVLDGGLLFAILRRLCHGVVFGL
jgi:hypothetical protein